MNDSVHSFKDIGQLVNKPNEEGQAPSASDAPASPAAEPTKAEEPAPKSFSEKHKEAMKEGMAAFEKAMRTAAAAGGEAKEACCGSKAMKVVAGAAVVIAAVTASYFAWNHFKGSSAE